MLNVFLFIYAGERFIVVAHDLKRATLAWKEFMREKISALETYEEVPDGPGSCQMIDADFVVIDRE